MAKNSGGSSLRRGPAIAGGDEGRIDERAEKGEKDSYIVKTTESIR